MPKNLGLYGDFDILEYCYILQREVFIFVNSKFIHGAHLLLAVSVSQLRVDKNNTLRSINARYLATWSTSSYSEW